MTTIIQPVISPSGRQYKLPDVSRLSFDAKKHAYTLDGTKLLTGVTSVIDGTSSKANLIGWAANKAVDHVLENRVLIGTPDEEELWREARTAHTRHKEKAASKGTDVHALVEEYILSSIEDNDGRPHVATFNKEILPFAEWAVQNNVRFLAAEQRLYSESHAVGGTCDFVAIIDGKLTIGDLKTFPKMWSADPFVQMGAYSLMWRELTNEAPQQSVVVKMCDPADERIKKYGGAPFAVYPRYALEEDEQMFLKRLEIYRYNQNFVSPKE